ncbi:hypothetical protein Tco_1191928 [Tanacetum coccineum]
MIPRTSLGSILRTYASFRSGPTNSTTLLIISSTFFGMFLNVFASSRDFIAPLKRRDLHDPPKHHDRPVVHVHLSFESLCFRRRLAETTVPTIFEYRQLYMAIDEFGKTISTSSEDSLLDDSLVFHVFILNDELPETYKNNLNKICKDKDEVEVRFSGLKELISCGHQRKWRTKSRSGGIPSEANSPRTNMRGSSPLHSPFGSGDNSQKDNVDQLPFQSPYGSPPKGSDSLHGQAMVIGIDAFRVSLSSDVSSSSQGSGHDDEDALGDVFVVGEITGDGGPHGVGSSVGAKMDSEEADELHQEETRNGQVPFIPSSGYHLTLPYKGPSSNFSTQQNKSTSGNDVVSSRDDTAPAKDLKQDTMSKSMPTLEPIAEKLRVEYPFPPHLEYHMEFEDDPTLVDINRVAELTCPDDPRTIWLSAL